MPTRSAAARVVAVAATAVLVLNGCSSSEPAPRATPSITAATPKGFDLPEGVTVTAGGTTLKVGKPATVVYELGDTAASAVTVTVSAITAASIKDFRFFSLDAATKKSSPFYVRVSVRNDGPAGLGGGALPMFALDSSRTSIPASDIVGSFKPCSSPTLPATFLPGASADLCLVYLLPEGRTLTSVTLQTGATKDAIAWKP